MGSTPTPGSSIPPTELVNFGIWLLNRGNRESTVLRKLKFLKCLRGSINDMYSQVLSSNWCDKSKEYALITIEQYSEFKGFKIKRPSFKVYKNKEVYVPNASMIKQLIYRIRSIKLRAMVMIAIETGATLSEVFNLTWNDVNFQNKTLTITGVKGHRSYTYTISDELVTLLSQIPKVNGRIFNVKNARTINDWLAIYKKRLAKETGNNDFLKIHFHTLRHFAISWKYFKTKDIVETQRFARHYNIQNTLKYVHIVKQWVKENEYDVVYANSQEELTKYLKEGYELVTKTEWGYCLRKPKIIT
ncbi:MAG: tyrosine-type recombinase/integrase [Nitrososphaeria archaeon]